MKTRNMMRMTTVKRQVLALAVLGVAITSQAAIYTWDGGGADSKFSTAANWVGDAVATSGSHRYVFSDVSLRNEVNTINGTSNRDTGAFEFAGGAFMVTQTAASLRLNDDGTAANGALIMNTASTITFNTTSLVLKNAIKGTGLGRVVINCGVAFDVSSSQVNTDATVELNGANGNTSGNTRLFTIVKGTVLVNNTTGRGLGESAVQVNSGSVLGGTGIIQPTFGWSSGASGRNDVTVLTGGRLSPGNFSNPTGTLTFLLDNMNGTTQTADLNINAGATFTFDMAAANDSDRVVVSAGWLRLNGQQFDDFTFNTLPGFTAGTYTLIDSVSTTGSLGAVTTGMIGDSKAKLMIVDNDLVLEVWPRGMVVIIR